MFLIKKVDNYITPLYLIIGNVIDRKTKIKFSAEWIFENSKERTLVGRANPIKMKLRIADPEILIIMKIASGRKSDLRDVFMLLGGDVDVGFILSELERYKLKGNLRTFKEYVNKKDFKDNLQGVFGKVDEKIFNRIIKKIEEDLK